MGEHGGAAEGPPSWAAGSPSPTSVAPRLNPFAVASLVASLVWGFGFASFAGIALGIHARNQIGRSGGRERGAGLATAGIVLGFIGFAAPILFIVAGSFLLIPR